MEIGLGLSGVWPPASLGAGSTRADFHDDGNIPDSRLLLKISARGWDKENAASFRIRLLTPSGPVDLLQSKRFITYATSKGLSFFY